ncbi:MAG: helix-turn-helix domain-containing protein [Solirubrobacteraceae bacterium]|nr:helix-turn-helix domain-containing protein [Solirubrobacteraceae bacterium]
MALHNDFADQNCSVARTLEVIGERWSLLILRDAFLGVRRFDQFQSRLGISRNVLTARLQHLVEQGVLRREQYSERPPRSEYCLTSRGRDLYPVIMAMVDFGDRHAPTPAGPPRIFTHKGCGGLLDKRHLRCEKCGEDVPLRELAQEKGPGFDGPIGTFGPVEERAPASG